MKAQWRLYSARFDALQMRERVLLSLSSLAVIYLLWDALLLGPLLEQRRHHDDRLAGLRQQLDSLQAEASGLAQSSRRDPDAGQKRLVENLRQQLSALEQQRSALSTGLVAAAQMPQILRQVLQGTGKLQLLSLQTLAVEELSLRRPEGGEAVGSGVYKHTVVLTLRGGYFEVVDYLRALEQLPWRFYWEQLAYQVEDYPDGRVDLHVYTLSAQKGMLDG